MLYINKITSDPSQTLILTGIPGIQINMNLRYLPRVQQWIMDIQYGTFQVTGLSVTSSLNLLRQWNNIIPFGIACLVQDGLDPYQVTDFANQTANLYLLNSTDVAQIESDWFP